MTNASEGTDGSLNLLCLSSAVHRRYRDDVLRAMALPLGAALTFRYEESIIDDDLREPLEKNELRDATALLAHVDLPEPPRNPSAIIPVRYAQLSQSLHAGSFYTLRFLLRDFAHAADLAAFRKQLPGTLPAYDTTESSWGGLWCVSVTPNLSCVERGEDLNLWQATARQLSAHASFAREHFYLHLLGVRGISDVGLVKPESGVYRLKADCDYELQIVHYSPTDDEHADPQQDIKHVVTVSSYDDTLSVRSTPTQPIDCPYDLKRVRFSTHHLGGKRDSRLAIESFELPLADHPFPQLQLEMVAKVLGNWKATAGLGIGIGLLLALTQLIGFWSNTDKAVAQTLPVAGAILFFGLLTGLIAAFGIRRPV